MPPKKQQVQPAENSQKREASQPKKQVKKEATQEEQKTTEPKSPLAKKRQSIEPKQQKSAKKPVKEDKVEETKKDAKPTKSIKSALPPKDLGPEPKRAKSAYNFFNASFVSELKAGNPETKQSDAFKLAGEKWGTMNEVDKKKFNDMAEKEKEIHEKRVAQRLKLGYFTFEDGSKSTDVKNKDAVKKEESKPKLTKGQEISEEDLVLQPPKVLSSYTLFMKSFQPPEGTANLDRMKVAGAAWNAMNEEAKKPYEELKKKDEQRRETQLQEMKKQGWFSMQDGTKSSDHKPKKKKSGKVAKQDVSGDESDEARAKPDKKKVVVTKPKQQPMTKKPELNIESSEITEKTPVAMVAKQQATADKSIKAKANGGKSRKLEAE